MIQATRLQFFSNGSRLWADVGSTSADLTLLAPAPVVGAVGLVLVLVLAAPGDLGFPWLLGAADQ